MSPRRQTIPPAQKYTVKQFNDRFPTDEACLDFLMQQRWPGGVAFCPKCEADRKHYPIKGRTAYCCPVCGNHIFPLAGTIFHKSPTSLRTWFHVIRLMSTTRAGISAKQIQRERGVTYKCAWRMMKQVRILMGEQIKLHGSIEMDEGYFGGSDSNKPAQLRHKRKATVLGIVERRGRVVPRVIADATKESILPVVAESVHPKAMVYTDGAHVFEQVRWMGQGHKHRAVNHSAGVYVDDFAHTNSIEGFWSLVKRGIQGVYYKVGADYLQSYLNEYAFRYNRRKAMRPMFLMLLEQTSTQVCPSAYEQRRLASPAS